nr:MAG TPA: hypothetical protein [Crassvirales sp.]
MNWSTFFSSTLLHVIYYVAAIITKEFQPVSACSLIY